MGVVITNAHSEVCFQCTFVFYAHPIPSPGLKNTYHRPCSACLIAVVIFHLPSMQIRIFFVYTDVHSTIASTNTAYLTGKNVHQRELWFSR